MQFRESTQFPPTNQGTTYVRSYTDASSTTNCGLYQEIDLNTEEVVSQYVITKNYTRKELSTIYNVEAALQIVKSHL